MKSISRVSAISTLALTVFVAGCATTGGGDQQSPAASNAASPSSQAAAPSAQSRALKYKEFVDRVPDLKVQVVGNAPADLLFSGIQGIAYRTHRAFQLYDKNMESEGGTIARRLEGLREQKGDEEFAKGIKDLPEKDRAQYQEYVDRQKRITTETIKALPEAIKLVAGLKNLKPNELAKNPLQTAAAANAVRLSLRQADYTVNALQYMNEMNSMLERAATFRGK